jgi:2'-hydroxyisoflavone reductase
VVRQSAELLAGAVGRYCFISSVSVYADHSGAVDEDSLVGTLEDESIEEMGGQYENYGPLKALCERVVQETYGDRALVIRPGLIAGPYDPTGRFTYWPHRLGRGGEVLAPGPPERRVQFIDVRDLAAWIVALLEESRGGMYNATCEGIEWGDLLAGANVTWVDDTFLVEHGVGEWMGLPLWIADPALAGLHQTVVARAVAAGLTFRPLAATLADTRALASLVDGVGPAPERERELLAAWHAR